MSFLERKLVERSMFRNLEKTLKETKKQMDFKANLPKSPAANAYGSKLTSRKFNPFETAGNSMFSGRSNSVAQSPPYSLKDGKKNAANLTPLRSNNNMNMMMMSNPFLSTGGKK